MEDNASAYSCQLHTLSQHICNLFQAKQVTELCDNRKRNDYPVSGGTNNRLSEA